MKSAHLLAAPLMIAACGAASAQTLVGAPGDASGIDGLIVDGKTYDVTWPGNSTFGQVFPQGLTFSSYATGADAASALAYALNLFSVTGIAGPCFAQNCNIAIPFEVDSVGDTYSWIVQTGAYYPINLTWTVATYANGWPGNVPWGYQWGVFTPVSTRVPEPATFALMIFGLAGVGFISRRRKV